MANEPKLNLNMVDVYGKPLGEQVDIILQHQVLSERVKASEMVNGPIELRGLRGGPEGRYRIDVDPPSYQYVSRFLNMKASGTTKLDLIFPIDPNKISSVNFPAYTSLPNELKQLLERSNRVQGFEGKAGGDLYDALAGDDIRRAGLLNIAAKTRVTRLTGGSTVLSSIGELLELRGDRFFASVPKQLREDTKNSVAEGLFHSVSGSLHHPPAGYTDAGSFKTSDHYGNLQLTFFMNGEDCVADIDIDDAAGIEHIYQVLHNMLSGEPTHPYNIHEILVGYQHIDPLYSFNV